MCLAENIFLVQMSKSVSWNIGFAPIAGLENGRTKTGMRQSDMLR